MNIIETLEELSDDELDAILGKSKPTPKTRLGSDVHIVNTHRSLLNVAAGVNSVPAHSTSG